MAPTAKRSSADDDGRSATSMFEHDQRSALVMRGLGRPSSSVGRRRPSQARNRAAWRRPFRSLEGPKIKAFVYSALFGGGPHPRVWRGPHPRVWRFVENSHSYVDFSHWEVTQESEFFTRDCGGVHTARWTRKKKRRQLAQQCGGLARGFRPTEAGMRRSPSW